MPATILVPSQHTVDATTTPFSQNVELAGWAMAGAFVRTWALGMQRRPLLERPHFHILFAAAGAGVGLLVSKFEASQLAQLEKQRDILTRRRMMRLQAASADA
ncbi:hypothetical protein DFJ77DRAFT_472066 [Powellomyces hirtus]|nr:hypothetical protein DFJ77DRAFT_472066 [Powellomyces hirtus]